MGKQAENILFLVYDFPGLVNIEKDLLLKKDVLLIEVVKYKVFETFVRLLILIYPQ